MQRFTLFLAVFLFFTGNLFSQESFRKYFGQPYPFAEESGFSVQKIGDRFTLIGSRENAASQSLDLAFWYFDPLTLELTDSTVFAKPDNQRIMNTYAGPDGGLLVIYEEDAPVVTNNLFFSYFGPDGTLAWENKLTDEFPSILFDDIQDVTFRSATELVLTFNTTGSGLEIGARIVFFSASEGVTSSLIYGEIYDGGKIWSLEHQPGGDLLIAGQRNGEVFVAMLAENGSVKWESAFEDVEGSFGSLRYDFLSDAHRPANDSVILVTGSVASDSRAFIVMDTLGNRLEEFQLEDFSLPIEGHEKATWLGDSLLLINDNYNEYFSLFPLDGYAPTEEYTVGQGSANGYRVRGSYFDIDSRSIFTASTFFSNDSDAAIVKFGFDNLDLLVKRIGTSGGSSEEQALGLLVKPEGEFLLLTRGIDPANESRVTFLSVDSQGQPVDTVLINDEFWQGSKPSIANTGAEDLLLLYTNFNRWNVYRYSQTGELRWSARIDDVNSLSEGMVVSLPDGRFAGREVTQEEAPGTLFGIIQYTRMLVADSTTAISDTVSTSRLGRSIVIAGSQDDLIFAGNSYTGDSVIIVSQDITTDNTNWEYNTSFGPGLSSRVLDLIQMSDGTYVAIVSAAVQVGENLTYNLSHLHLSATGAELFRQEFASELTTFPTTVVREGVVGEITIAYGTSAISPAGGDEQVYELMVKKLVAATGEELLTTAFNSPFSSTTPIDLKPLEDGRTAIIANATASATSASQDVLFLVFDAEGNITSLRTSETSGIDITLSPNPTPGLAKLVFNEETAGPMELVLIDVNGRQLFRQQLSGMPGDSQVLDLSAQPTGTYFVLLRSRDGRMETRRLVKQ